VQFHTGTTAVLQPALMANMARYRHKVFVGKLGWPLQCTDGLEYDEFDRDDTVYVVAQDPFGELVGASRLLPTTRPYLLATVFPELWGGDPLPDSPDIWEVSRFAAVDFNAQQGPLFQMLSRNASELLHATVRAARDRGARQLISISPVGVERLLRAAGYQAHRAGPCRVIDGQPLFACVTQI
jgi:acyl homoserine lactone synthase